MLTIRSTQVNQTSAPLLRLLAEIRNQIFGYVFEGDTISVTKRDSKTYKVVYFREHEPGTQPQPWLDYIALTCVSRQVHYETKLLLWKLGTFYVLSVSTSLK